ncbi:MAG TPA: hypothetical protein VN541_13900 [Tepidisphaeraceae bacterium]|nr:hypothetical protein [Tepidisphaeraceae bacterium]
MHVMFFSLLVFAAIIITAVIFVFWLVVTIIRGLARLVVGPGLKPPPVLPPHDPQNTRRCVRDSCRSINPAEARFCRRCGQRLDDPHHVAVRRVAMF